MQAVTRKSSCANTQEAYQPRHLPDGGEGTYSGLDRGVPTQVWMGGYLLSGLDRGGSGQVQPGGRGYLGRGEGGYLGWGEGGTLARGGGGYLGWGRGVPWPGGGGYLGRYPPPPPGCGQTDKLKILPPLVLRTRSVINATGSATEQAF